MHCKGEAQRSPLFWRFSGGFWFSQDRLLCRNSTRKPLNLIKSPIFTNAPCKTACLYNAPSMHTLDYFPVCFHFRIFANANAAMRRTKNCCPQPKGPFHTKNTTTIAKIVNYYAVVFFTTPPKFSTPWTLLWEDKRLQFPGKWCSHEVRRDSKSLCGTRSTTRNNLLRVVFLVRRGPLGKDS